MLLGTLSLFQKRGIFYEEQQLYSKDRFSEIQHEELKPDEVWKTSELPKQFQITPLTVSGDTDYITATFEDEGKAEYPYEVTVWLLVEDSQREIK